MNHLNQSLDRLFKAAAQAPREDPPPLPFILEAETLARWRSRIPDEETEHLAVLFRRAVICASMIMLASIGWSRLEHEREPAVATVLTQYEIAMDILP
jgi:hypothetical protein